MLDALTLDQMRVFLAVCDAGSFSAAARRLRRAQSAVSHAVMGLEAALGVSLFDRAGRLPALTPAGRALAVDARAVVGRADEMKARARAIARDVEPELSLSVDPLLPRAPLMRALEALRDVFPLLPVALYTEGLGASEARIADGTCSFGFSSVGAAGIGNPSLERRYLLDVPIVIVAAPGHPLAAVGAALSQADLRRHTQLVLTDRSPLTQGFQGGVVADQVWRFADLDTKHAFLLAGLGWGGMPRHMVESDLATGRLTVLATDAPPRPIPLSLVHRRGEPPGRAGRWLLGRLEATIGECPVELVSSASAAPARAPD